MDREAPKACWQGAVPDVKKGLNPEINKVFHMVKNRAFFYKKIFIFYPQFPIYCGSGFVDKRGINIKYEMFHDI